MWRRPRPLLWEGARSLGGFGTLVLKRAMGSGVLEEGRVISGPTGTGKTTLLRERILHLINEEGVAPSAITVLLPSPVAGRKLEMQINAATPFTPYDSCQIVTFEGFAARLLRNMNKEFSDRFSYRSMEATEVFAGLEGLYPGRSLQRLPPSPLIRYFAHLESIGVSVEQVAACINDKGAKGKCTSEELAEFYGGFLSIVRDGPSRVLLSSTSCVPHLRRSLEELLLSESSSMAHLREWCGLGSHLLVDDLQFFSQEHLSLLGSLIKNEVACHISSLTITCDDSLRLGSSFQSTLTAESASQFLQDMYSRPPVIQELFEKHYVQSSISDVVDSLSRSEELRQRVFQQYSEQLPVFCFPKEAQGLSNSIASQIGSGVSDEEILVLLRTNNEVKMTCEELEACGVPTQSSGERLFDVPLARILVSYLCLLITNSSPKLYWDMLTAPSPFAISSELLDSLVSECVDLSMIKGVYKEPQSWIENRLCSFSTGVSETDKSRLDSFLQLLTSGRRALAEQEPIHVISDNLCKSLQLDEHLASPLSSNSEFQNVSRVIRIIRSLEDQPNITGHSVIQKLHGLRCSNQDKTVRWEDEDSERIRVMTIHRALMEGATAKHVFLPSFTASNYPLSWSQNPLQRFIPEQTLQWQEPQNGEAALLRAALTRANSSIHFSFQKGQSPSPWIPHQAISVASPADDMESSLEDSPSASALFKPDSVKFTHRSTQSSGPHAPSISYHTIRTLERCPLKYVLHKLHPTRHTLKVSAGLRKSKANFSHLGILLRLACPTLFQNSFWLDCSKEGESLLLNDSILVRHACQISDGYTSRSSGLDNISLEDQLSQVLEGIKKFASTERPMLSPSPTLALQFCDGDITFVGADAAVGSRPSATEAVIMNDKLSDYGARSSRFQVELYLYLCERIHGIRPREVVISQYHPDNRQIISPSDRIYQRMDHLVSLLDQAFHSKRFHASPETLTCKSCKFALLCPSSSHKPISTVDPRQETLVQLE